MIGVVVSIENGQAENQWDYLLSNFAPDMFWLIHPDNHVPGCKLCKAAPRIKTCGELPKDVPLVLMTNRDARYIKGDTPLLSFEHPDNAIYMFGSNNEKLFEGEGSYFEDRIADHKVFIPLDSKHEMFSWIAGGITFWDRKCQQIRGILESSLGKPNNRQ